MKTLKQSYLINASLEKVWQALVDPKQIDNWGAGPVKMDDKVGSKFSLWGGDIYGKNVEIVKEKTLIQDWYAGNWPQASKVTFTLRKISENETQIDLIHENIPDSEAKEIYDGWNRYYLGAIKNYLENKKGVRKNAASTN